MRKFYIAILLLAATNSFSQTRTVLTHTDRGMKMVGGQVQLSYIDLFSSETVLRVNDFTSTYGALVSPNVGWFVEKNWMFGTMLHLGFYREKSGKNTTTKSVEDAYDLGITPFSRYYIDLARRGNIKVFLQAGLPVIYSSYERTNSYSSGTQIVTNTSTSKNLGLYGNFGFGASLHGRFGAIEMNASNLGLNIGIQKFISRKAN
jgi:hypothetical protein